MKSFILQLVLVCLLALYSSCIKHSEVLDKDNLEVFPLEETIESNGSVLLLSEIAVKSYFFKPSSADVILGRIEKVERKDTLFFIQDNLDNLYIFGSTGDFVGLVGKKGRGPTEYLEITDFAINPFKNEIAVLDGAFRAILFYDTNGQFLRSFKVNHIESQIRYLDTVTIITYTNRVVEALNSHFLINVIDLNGKDISRLKNVKDEKIPPYSPVLTFEKIKNYHDTVCYYDNIDNIIYHIGKNELFPIIELDFGKYSMPIKYLLFEKYPTQEVFNEMSNFFSSHWFLETSRFFFFEGLFHRRLKLLVIDKKLKYAFSPNISWGQMEQGFLNDLGGGGIFWPDGSFYDGELYSIIDPYKLSNILRYPIFTGYGIDTKSLESDLEKTNESTNPWIMIVELK
jgi:hypothetical protein